MGSPASAIPPQPPGVVTQQQGPALAEYAKKAAGGSPDKEFVKQGLNQIAEILMKIAKAMQVTNPELMPLVQRMAGAGKVLEQEFTKTSQGQGGSIPAGPESAPSSDTAPEGPQGMGM